MVHDIIAATAAWYGLTSADIRSRQTLQTLSDPRGVAMYVASILIPMSQAEIGRHFGRSPQTVRSAIAKVDLAVWSKRDPDITDAVLGVWRQVRGHHA